MPPLNCQPRSSTPAQTEWLCTNLSVGFSPCRTKTQEETKATYRMSVIIYCPSSMKRCIHICALWPDSHKTHSHLLVLGKTKWQPVSMTPGSHLYWSQRIIKVPSTQCFPLQRGKQKELRLKFISKQSASLKAPAKINHVCYQEKQTFRVDSCITRHLTKLVGFNRNVLQHRFSECRRSFIQLRLLFICFLAAVLLKVVFY